MNESPNPMYSDVWKYLSKHLTNSGGNDDRNSDIWIWIFFNSNIQYKDFPTNVGLGE